MAALTDMEKVMLRNAMERKSTATGTPIRWVKAAAHDTAQAIEDIIDGAAFKTAVSDAMDAAASPYGITWTNTEKKWIAALVFQLKFNRDISG